MLFYKNLQAYLQQAARYACFALPKGCTQRIRDPLREEEWSRLKIQKETLQELFRSGVQYTQKKDWAVGASILEEYLRNEKLKAKEQEKALRPLLRCYEQEGHIQEAIHTLRSYLGRSLAGQNRELWMVEYQRLQGEKERREKIWKQISVSYGKGEWKRAVNLLETYLQKENFDSKNYGKALKTLIQCYKNLHYYREGIQQIERYISVYNPSDVKSWMGEKNYLKNLWDEYKRQIGWEASLERLEWMFLKHRKFNHFQARSRKNAYKRPSKITLITHSNKKRDWHVFWVDEDGIFYLNTLATGKTLPPLEGKMLVKLSSSTRAGRVMLLILAGGDPPQDLREISKKSIKKGVEEERRKLGEFLRYLEGEVGKDGRYTEVVKVEFK